MADIVFSSTMKRCVQTAKIIYPEKDILKEELLKECDFGILRKKLYGAVGRAFVSAMD